MNLGKGLKDFGKGFSIGIRMDDDSELTEENDNVPTSLGKYAGFYLKEFSREFGHEFCHEAGNELKKLALLKFQNLIKREKHNE